MIHSVLETGLNSFDEQSLKEMLEHANAAASLITGRKRRLSVMPEPEEIAEFIQRSEN